MRLATCDKDGFLKVIDMKKNNTRNWAGLEVTLHHFVIIFCKPGKNGEGAIRESVYQGRLTH